MSFIPVDVYGLRRSGRRLLDLVVRCALKSRTSVPNDLTGGCWQVVRLFCVCSLLVSCRKRSIYETGAGVTDLCSITGIGTLPKVRSSSTGFCTFCETGAGVTGPFSITGIGTTNMLCLVMATVLRESKNSYNDGTRHSRRFTLSLYETIILFRTSSSFKCVTLTQL